MECLLHPSNREGPTFRTIIAFSFNTHSYGMENMSMRQNDGMNKELQLWHIVVASVVDTFCSLGVIVSLALGLRQPGKRGMHIINKFVTCLLQMTITSACL